MTLQGLKPAEDLAGASQLFQNFVRSIRLFIRDFPELNRLVDGEESSDKMIAWAVIDAIEDFNGTPPLLGTYTFSDLISANQASLLRKGTLVNLLMSVGILQTRNQLPFSDGGLNVSVSDKAPLLQSWLGMLMPQWQQGKKEVKSAWNVESFFGMGSGTHTEYYLLDGYYHVDLTR